MNRAIEYPQLICPKCGIVLSVKDLKADCDNCFSAYPVKNNVPILFRDNILRDILSAEWERAANQLGRATVTEKINTSIDIRVWQAVSAINEIVENKKASILDIGCGAGTNILLLKALDYENFTATDFSLNCIEAAKKINKESNFIVSDCLPFKNNTFDAVISTAVIEHVTDQDSFVDDIFRILNKGGIAVVTSDCFVYRFYKAIGAYRTIQPIDVAPNPLKLLRKFKDVGFTVLHYEGFSSERFLFAKNVLKAIIRRGIGEKNFSRIKNERNKNLEKGRFLNKEEVRYCLPKIVFRTTLYGLWKTSFSQQNIFIVKK